MRKPSKSLSRLVTSSPTRASTSGYGAGSGTVGPISNCRRTPRLGISARSGAREGDAQHAPDLVGQFLRFHRRVGVADAPELFRVAQVARADVVEAVAFDH